MAFWGLLFSLSRHLHQNEKTQQFLSSWGITLSPKMVEVDARLLPTPTMICADDRTVVPRDGAWRLDSGLAFSSAKRLTSWSIAVFGDERSCNVNAVQNFVRMMESCLRKLGMDIFVPRDVEKLVVYQRDRGDYQGTLKDAEKAAIRVGEDAGDRAGDYERQGTKVDMILCVIMNKSDGTYQEVKRYAETNMGAITQCMLSKHLFTAKYAYVANLALKINVKLGGSNYFMVCTPFSLFTSPCVQDPPKELPVVGSGSPIMLFGADVTHSVDGKGGSIAAVVGSMDSRFTEYRACIRNQGGRTDIIEEFELMAKELMLQFKHLNSGHLPERIVCFRDGVSDGEKGSVVKSEVKALKNAADSLGGVDNIAITFVCVTKRHHTRFFPEGTDDFDRNGNLLPGTVVDTGIVDPYEVFPYFG